MVREKLKIKITVDFVTNVYRSILISNVSTQL